MYHAPRELDLTRPDVNPDILVTSRAEFDVGWFMGVPEAQFRAFVETVCHVVDVLHTSVTGASEFVCKIP